MNTRSSSIAAFAMSCALSCALPIAGCVSHNVKSEPIEIKPIHITMDINLKVQRELDDFFDFEERTEPESRPQEASNPEGK